MKRFESKVVLVTGGSSGIGKATAEAFAGEGAKVVVSARREKEGVEVVKGIQATGGTARFIRADVAIDPR
jgi:NAD(P)-dependent dehydrogenase (short-subunit alcohol dehydrogenase family)